MAIMVMAALAPVGPHGRVMCQLVVRCPDAVLAASLAAPTLLSELSRCARVGPQLLCSCSLTLR